MGTKGMILTYITPHLFVPSLFSLQEQKTLTFEVTTPKVRYGSPKGITSNVIHAHF
jgi:hypothetical protein